MKYQLGCSLYNTKKSVKERCREILYSTDGLVEGKDKEFLLDLFQMHHRYKDVILEHNRVNIYVSSCFINYNNRSFCLSVDGVHSLKDISYNKALSEYSKETIVKRAFRNTVQQDMNDFKDTYFEKESNNMGYVVCPVTNLKIKRKDSHLDHYPVTFNKILLDFMEHYDLCFEDIAIVSEPFKPSNIADKALAKDFRTWHSKRAEYRVVLDKVNLQRKRT